MDLNNINSNILIHAGGKCASHRLMDLLMLNNANLTVQVPGKNIPFFEPNYVEHWKLDPNEKTKDLNSINQQGKYWLLKTGGTPLYVYHMENIFDNITEIGLVRENISDSVASYVLTFLNNWLFHIHTSEQILKISNRENEFIDMLQSNPKIQQVLAQAFHATISYTLNILTLRHTRNFPIYTYDQISLNPESLFDYCGNHTVIFDQNAISKPIPRLKTPELPEFREALNPMLNELIKDEMIESLNVIAPSGITFI